MTECLAWGHLLCEWEEPWPSRLNPRTVSVKDGNQNKDGRALWWLTET